MKLQITLTGNRSMLQHNGRLANALDPYTRRLKELTGKTKKTEDDLMEIMSVEARGSAWETPDRLLGVPTGAVWRSLYDAATAFKLGQQVKRSLLTDDGVQPILIGGETVLVDEFLGDSTHVDYRSVVVNRNRVMRARTLVPAGWVTTHTVELLNDVIDLHRLTPVFERAGRLVGIGDWRPTYGTYTMSVEAL